MSRSIRLAVSPLSAISLLMAGGLWMSSSLAGSEASASDSSASKPATVKPTWSAQPAEASAPAVAAEPAAAGESAAPSIELDGWRSPEEARAVSNPLTADDDVIATAAKMYKSACAKCHGPQGKGDGRTARFLDVQPADFTERVPHETDGEIFWKLTNGKQPMPSFEKDLSEEQRWGLVHFLRTLAPSEAAADAESGDEGSSE